jgi:hypothetical protein
MSRQLNAAWLILIMKIGLRPDARLTPAGRNGTRLSLR